MAQLTAGQFRRVEELYFQASSLPPEQRDSFLAGACADDPDVREEVRSLLSHSGGANAAGPGAGAAAGSGAAAGESRREADSSGGAFGRTILDDALAAIVAGPASKAASDALLRQLIGTRVGAYEFTDILGQGGMGVVYLARDVRLGRTVAVKSLPPGFSRQPLRMSRFVREAKILASLSHSNIATVYGLEEAAGTKFLVMERVEGETLARRLSRGPLPVDEALEVSCEIASGVEAAHAAGVVHRDLKPGNVMFRPDGKIKVLDFGLAREVGTSVASLDKLLDEHDSRSAAANLTQEGLALGTPGYMSPEQVRGKPLDRRTDVFSLGCILYECLSGHLAFPGDTAADIMAGILERDPDWKRLPTNTPASVRRLLARCLAKDPADRMRDMGDVRMALEDALAAREWLQQPRPADGAQVRPRPSRLLTWGLPLGISGALLAAAVAIVATRPAPPAAPAPEPLRRFSLAFPDGAPQPDLPRVRLALARDGSRVVVSATDGAERHLWVRERADTEFRKIDGTHDAAAPAFSPDGEWLAYFADGLLWRRRLAGGNPVKVVDLPGEGGGYHWDADRQITYAPVRGGGLARVAEDGGLPRFVTAPRHDKGERAHAPGTALPDGSAILFTVRAAGGTPRIEARHLGAARQHVVVEHGSTPRVARTPLGACLGWERAGTLYAARFDAASLKLLGAEVAVADGVMVDRAASLACFDVADDGTLAYVPGPVFMEESRLAWLDPADFEAPPVPLGDERRALADPRLTADGRRLSVVVKGDVHRPYVVDLAQRNIQRVVTEGSCTAAAISPDGGRLAYVADRNGPPTLWVKDLANGTEEQLTGAGTDVGAGRPGDVSWSPDGRRIAFSLTPHDSARRDVWWLDLDTKKAKPLSAAADADERSPRFSPDGKWVAYSSTESGAREVYIESFPEGTGLRVVSTGGGGDWPEWTPDSRKLYYRGKGGLYLAPIAPNWADGSRPALVCRLPFGQSDADFSDYTVAPDGRVLIVEPSERAPSVSHVTVVLNWHRLLESVAAPAAAQR